MQNLVFLNLRETSISVLTPCIQNLKKLSVLMFDRNGSYEIFKQIPIPIEHLIKLGNLSVLYLQHSKFKELDKDFGRLVNLRVIDFTCTKIDIIRSKVFSSLKNLEVLYMHTSFDHWKANNDEDVDCMAFEELSTLENLYELRVDITNKDIISDKYKVIQNFLSFKHFSIRSGFGYLSSHMSMDINYLVLDQNIENIAQWLKLLLIKTKKLLMVVDCQHSVNALINPDFENDIHNLEFLMIDNSSNYKNAIQAFECMCAPEECPYNMKVQWASMEIIHVLYCPNWKPRLIFGQQSVPALQAFYCKKEWLEQLNWDDKDKKKQNQSVHLEISKN
ncbi:hypothetical protein ZOSMA_143G00200 [Zostera marina]|uniref:NB-ARC domain-containing disease resistance protein n=1 Tax=Zostera marina TaxID=29655 RepID=A0A0K9PZP1_ZOSMR|nr:hypothetical protein ZOSMA_143G00200 [Zostera marina]